jgi:hypothetical protein
MPSPTETNNAIGTSYYLHLCSLFFRPLASARICACVLRSSSLRGAHQQTSINTTEQNFDETSIYCTVIETQRSHRLTGLYLCVS